MAAQPGDASDAAMVIRIHDTRPAGVLLCDGEAPSDGSVAVEPRMACSRLPRKGWTPHNASRAESSCAGIEQGTNALTAVRCDSI